MNRVSGCLVAGWPNATSALTCKPAIGVTAKAEAGLSVLGFAALPSVRHATGEEMWLLGALTVHAFVFLPACTPQ